MSRKKQLHFGSNLGHVTVGSRSWLWLGVSHDTPRHLVFRWGSSHILRHWVSFIRHLFNSNNFARSVALAEVCTLMNAILLIIHTVGLHKITNSHYQWTNITASDKTDRQPPSVHYAPGGGSIITVNCRHSSCINANAILWMLLC